MEFAELFSKDRACVGLARAFNAKANNALAYDAVNVKLKVWSKLHHPVCCCWCRAGGDDFACFLFCHVLELLFESSRICYTRCNLRVTP